MALWQAAKMRDTIALFLASQKHLSDVLAVKLHLM